MKLEHNQLLKAKECQLQVLGLTRKKNKGWLKQALKRDFDPELVEAFHQADTRPHQPTKTQPAANPRSGPNKKTARAFSFFDQKALDYANGVFEANRDEFSGA